MWYGIEVSKIPADFLSNTSVTWDEIDITSPVRATLVAIPEEEWSKALEELGIDDQNSALNMIATNRTGIAFYEPLRTVEIPTTPIPEVLP